MNTVVSLTNFESTRGLNQILFKCTLCLYDLGSLNPSLQILKNVKGSQKKVKTFDVITEYLLELFHLLGWNKFVNNVTALSGTFLGNW